MRPSVCTSFTLFTFIACGSFIPLSHPPIRCSVFCHVVSPLSLVVAALQVVAMVHCSLRNTRSKPLARHLLLLIPVVRAHWKWGKLCGDARLVGMVMLMWRRHFHSATPSNCGNPLKPVEIWRSTYGVGCVWFPAFVSGYRL